MRRIRLGLIAAAFGLCLCAGPSALAAGIQVPNGPNVDLVYGKCRTCHDLQYLKESEGISARAWSDILDSMHQYGLRLDKETHDKVLEYLSTYLGPNPPPPPAEATAAAEPQKVDGATLFTDNCSACHQPDGKGIEGQFPPLAGNADLYADRRFPIYVVLHGMEGPITVEGADYDGQMPEFGHLSDAEIAAVLNHERASWGNEQFRPDGFVDLTPEDVAKARERSMTPNQVHALRKTLIQ